MQRDENRPHDETVDALVSEAADDWGNTTEHEPLQATGRAETHLETPGAPSDQP